MLKGKSKLLVIFFFIAILSISYYANALADSNDNTGWNVRITSDGTKDLMEGTKDITFEVKDNPNVVKGKIAPGTTATALIDVNLEGTEYPVEISAFIDDSNLKYKNFELSAKIDGEKTSLNEAKVFEPENHKVFTNLDGKKVIELEITWNESGEDTNIGSIGETIDLPIKIKVEQHI